MNVIEELESREMAKREIQIPEFSSGDTVKVSVNVIEGERKRVQAFEGVRSRSEPFGFGPQDLPAGSETSLFTAQEPL